MGGQGLGLSPHTHLFACLLCVCALFFFYKSLHFHTAPWRVACANAWNDILERLESLSLRHTTSLNTRDMTFAAGGCLSYLGCSVRPRHPTQQKISRSSPDAPMMSPKRAKAIPALGSSRSVILFILFPCLYHSVFAVTTLSDSGQVYLSLFRLFLFFAL